MSDPAPLPPARFRYEMDPFDHSLSAEAREWVESVTPPGYDGMKPQEPVEILPFP